MTTSSTSLQIAILGTGNIGSTYAYHFAQAGHDVTVIARPGSVRLRQLRRDEAIVDVDGKRADVHVLDALDEKVSYDLLIVTLLDHQIDAVLPALQRSTAQCVQFMFNTFTPERLQETVGAERCAFGMNFVQATLDDDGRLKATGGAAGQKTLMDRQRWADVFNAAGLPAVVEPNMPLWLRCHVPLCVAFESVSIAGVRRGKGASWTEASTLARGVHASFRLIEHLGHPVYPKTKRVLARTPTPFIAAMLWSMSRIRSFRELLALGRAECDALVDAMVSAAAALAPGNVSVSEIKAMKPM